MSETKGVIGELARIQKELKAPKNQLNKFGGYKYRSAEDILEGVKKVLNGCALLVRDEIVMIGERYYVKATAELVAPNGDAAIATAFAREADQKKGMDSAQVTGATSSYARKYALNGLFAIDDTKDADADETPPAPKQPAKKAAKKVANKTAKSGPVTQEQRAEIHKLLGEVINADNEYDQDRLQKGINLLVGKDDATVAMMTQEQAAKFASQLKKILK